MIYSLMLKGLDAAEFIIAHNRRFEEEIMYLQQTVLIRVQQQLSNARRQMNQVQNIVTNVSRELLAGHHKTLSAVSHFMILLEVSCDF